MRVCVSCDDFKSVRYNVACAIQVPGNFNINIWKMVQKIAFCYLEKKPFEVFVT